MTEALDEDGCLLVGRFFVVLLRGDALARQAGKKASVAALIRCFIRAETGRYTTGKRIAATSEVLDQIREMRRQGMKYAEIGKHFNRSRAWANKVALTNGIGCEED